MSEQSNLLYEIADSIQSVKNRNSKLEMIILQLFALYRKNHKDHKEYLRDLETFKRSLPCVLGDFQE